MIALKIGQPVGRSQPNRANDVIAVARALVHIGKIPLTYVSNGEFDNALLMGIADTQSHWMAKPDGIIACSGRTIEFIRNWSIKPIDSSVLLPGRLREAWDTVSPLLPAGSRCTSGYRDASQQRRILHGFFRSTFKAQVIEKYSQAEYDKFNHDLAVNEQRALEMLRGIGQQIATPGKSAHQLGKAIDVGGPSDNKQVEIIKLVWRAHPRLLSGKVLKERNGCVHFEIL